MSSMNKTKEEINLKKLLLRRKNTGSIFVIAGLDDFCNSVVHIYSAKFLH